MSHAVLLPDTFLDSSCYQVGTLVWNQILRKLVTQVCKQLPLTPASIMQSTMQLSRTAPSQRLARPSAVARRSPVARRQMTVRAEVSTEDQID